MKVVVVGASGYLGHPLWEAARRRTEAVGTSTRGQAPLIPFDLAEPSWRVLDWVPREGAVIVCAAISSPDLCAREPERARAVNVTGTAKLVQYAIDRGNKVLFLSSDTVYGERQEPFEEDGLGSPAGDYAGMKREVEARFQGLPQFKTARLSYVVSRQDKFTASVEAAASTGREVEVFHPFNRAVIHRSDVIEGVLNLVERWQEVDSPVINFGGPEVVSRVDFVRSLLPYLPQLSYRITEPPPEFFANRPRVIAMKSPLLNGLLGRPARSLAEIWKNEFVNREVLG